MNKEKLQQLLEDIKAGKLSTQEGLELLQETYYKDLGYAKVDNQREARIGCAEIIFCEGKTIEQLKGIVTYMYERGNNILATRANEEIYQAIKNLYDETEYNTLARTIVIKRKTIKKTKTYIAIVTAGTSDMPVAEEAYITAEFLGNKVERIIDVGIAGIHRLFDKLDIIRNSRVIIVIAGMEGALASVIGGLVNKPIIAVPTSVGYGSNFEGLSALLGMLNSCAGGVSVVNIDNGFGAAYQANMINRL